MIITTKYRKISINDNIWIIYLIIFSTILIPSIKINTLPAFRVEQLILIVSLFFLYIKLTIGKRIKNINMLFPVMNAGLSILVVLSILVGSFKGINIIVNDFFDIYKIVLNTGIYMLTTLIIKDEKTKVKVLKFMLTCIIISVLISTQQYFNLFDLNEKYVPLIAPTQYKTLVNNYPDPRVIGMTSNPNVYSVMPGIGVLLAWSLFLLTRKKKYILYILICAFGTIMTMSRTGFVFLICIVVWFTYLYLFKHNLRNLLKGHLSMETLKLIMIILLIFILAIVTFKILPEKYTWRFKAGMDLKTDNSFQARVRNWQEHIDYFKISPIFGLGPAKSIEYERHADNEWILLLRKYGIVGTLYLALAFILPFIKAPDNFFKYIYFSALVGSAIYMIPAAIYHSFHLMPLIMVLAGLAGEHNGMEYNRIVLLR